MASPSEPGRLGQLFANLLADNLFDDKTSAQSDASIPSDLIGVEAAGNAVATLTESGKPGVFVLGEQDGDRPVRLTWTRLSKRLRRAEYLAAEAVGNGYQALFQRGSKVYLAKFNSRGVLKRSRKLRGSQLESAEVRFGVDLNGDGSIGSGSSEFSPEPKMPNPGPLVPDTSASRDASESTTFLPVGSSDGSQIGGGGTAPIGGGGIAAIGGGGTTPTGGGGTAPTDGGGTTPTDGGGTAPTDSGGTTPTDGGGTVQPQPIVITTQAPTPLDGFGNGIGLQRFGTPEAALTDAVLDPTQDATARDPRGNGLDLFLNNLLGLVRGGPGLVADVGVHDPANPNGEIPQYDVSGVRNYLGGRDTPLNYDVNGVALATPDQLINSQGISSANWAKAGGTFIRLTNANWGGAVGQPTGFETSFGVDTTPRLVEGVNQSLPNARLVSNLLGAQDAPVPNSVPGEAASWNVYLMSFGQYFDHGLSFLARSGANQAMASGTAVGDPLHAVSRGSVGVVGDRGAQYVLRAGTQELVQVAWFDTPGAGLEPGLYSFEQINGMPVAGESAESIAGVPELGPNDLLFKNMTEALIQNNQMYGSSDAVAYLLRESARFDTSVDGQPAYIDAMGTRYISGQSVAGTPWMVEVGGAGDLVKLVPDVSSLSAEDVALLTNRLHGGFSLVKTAEMLKSRIVTGDGLPGLPTYGEVLINNGVDPAKVQAVLTGQGGMGSAIGSPEWNYLATDPRFVDAGNVYDFSDKNTGFSGQPLIGDIALAVSANSLSDPSQFGRLSAIDQNLDGTPDIVGNGQPLISGEDWGAGLLLSHMAGGDWRANENVGLTTIHTMWAREHNYWTTALKTLAANNGVSGVSEEEFFQMARIVVEAEYQKLIFQQFAPSLAGDIPVNFANFPDPALPPDHGFDGYNPAVDPSISLEFAVAAYRVGHSQIPNDILPGISMLEGFLNPQLTASLGSTAIQAGLLGVAHDAIDTMLTNGVRNELITRNLDLFTANVLRGREVGLASMNAMRAQLSGFDANGTFMYESVALGQDGLSGTLDDGSGSGLAPQEYMPLNLRNGTDITRGILGADGLYGTADDAAAALNTNGFVGNINLKPYLSWAEFGDSLRGADSTEKDQLLAKFIAAYDPDAALQADRLAYASAKVLQIREAQVALAQDPANTELQQLAQYGAGLDQVDAWVGMLAEQPAADGSTGQMGSLMAAVFWEQMDRLQEADPFYYISRVQPLGQRFWDGGISPLEDILARTSLPGLMEQMPGILNPPVAEPVDPLAPHVPAVFFTQGNTVNTDFVDQVINPNGAGTIPTFSTASATDPNNLVLGQPELMPQYDLVGRQMRNVSYLYTGGETADPWSGYVPANVGANFADPNQTLNGNSPSNGSGVVFNDVVFQSPQEASTVTIL